MVKYLGSRTYPPLVWYDIILHVLKGAKYLHTCKFVHCDLRWDNVVLCDEDIDGQCADQISATIIDLEHAVPVLWPVEPQDDHMKAWGPENQALFGRDHVTGMVDLYCIGQMILQLIGKCECLAEWEDVAMELVRGGVKTAEDAIDRWKCVPRDVRPE